TVTKEEMIARLWPESFVEEGSLSQNIFLLRKALGGDAQGNQIIKTVPKRGYSFIADVSEVREGETGLLIEQQRHSEIVSGEQASEPGARRVFAVASPFANRSRARTLARRLLIVAVVGVLAGTAYLLRTAVRRELQQHLQRARRDLREGRRDLDAEPDERRAPPTDSPHHGQCRSLQALPERPLLLESQRHQGH